MCQQALSILHQETNLLKKMNKLSENDSGVLSFSIESRILKELGERLVRAPEVALIELIKNAYDADATECMVSYDPQNSIVISDNGIGMTLDAFKKGWMRVGTSNKDYDRSREFGRLITGEKGIGRFSVRFLGNKLNISTVAEYDDRKKRQLQILFYWSEFDNNKDLNNLEVPYKLKRVRSKTPTGTTLEITDLRDESLEIKMRKVKSGSIGMVNPLQSLFGRIENFHFDTSRYKDEDPGFSLNIEGDDIDEHSDVASEVLNASIIRAKLRLKDSNLNLDIFTNDLTKPYFSVNDTYESELGDVYADIRFLPYRKGIYSGLGIDGKEARKFVRDNCGIAVFDRNFRIHPYGGESDDWLSLQTDAGRSLGEPRSSISKSHFDMSKEEKAENSLNWMLRLPKNNQLIGIVQLDGRRSRECEEGEDKGLIAAADREGFLENKAFRQLWDIVRGSVEAIAFVDRKIQQEEIQAVQDKQIALLKRDTDAAVIEIAESDNISEKDKKTIIGALVRSQTLVQSNEEIFRSREQQLEIMSMLGIVGGYLTHEFGIAMRELKTVQVEIEKVLNKIPELKSSAIKFDNVLENLKEFIGFTTGYIHGTKSMPKVQYPVKPRIERVTETFGKYARRRNIQIENLCDPELLSPLVPAALYDGILLNLYTNSLKAVTAKLRNKNGKIIFNAWNQSNKHYLEVSDNGIGIPGPLQNRVFEPLFTTTDSRDDPLGSGMGLGLSLVRRGVYAFGGNIEFVNPGKKNIKTCVQVSFPIKPLNHGENYEK